MGGTGLLSEGMFCLKTKKKSLKCGLYASDILGRFGGGGLFIIICYV